MFESTLQNFDLSEHDSKVYELLLKNGPSLGPTIVTKTGINRTNVYAILKKLIEKGLVQEKKEEKKRKTVYSATQPEKLYKILKKKEEDLFLFKQNFDTVYNQINSLYKSSTEKPIIQILAGVDGIEQFYTKMLEAKETILIFVSQYGKVDKEHEKLIDKNIQDRVKRNLKVNALYPLEKKYPLSGYISFLKDRKEKLIEIRTLPPEFTVPSQIIVFDDKVGITSLKKELVTTFIENDNIATTFKTMFQYMWQESLEYHYAIVKKAQGLKSK